MDKTIIKKIDSFFESHNQLYMDCFITSDEQLFYNRRSAADHSERLDNNQIYHVSRGTNIEDWLEDVAVARKMIDDAQEEFKSQDLEFTPKWGWWNWLYKILH